MRASFLIALSLLILAPGAHAEGGDAAAGKRQFAPCTACHTVDEGGPNKVTRDARYATVCIIKLMIAIEILMLAEKSQLSLDSPVGEYLPELFLIPQDLPLVPEDRLLVAECRLRH